METIEKILESADFSEESNYRNLLYYKLFGKPVTVSSASLSELNTDLLSCIAGGNQNGKPAGGNSDIFNDKDREYKIPNEYKKG